MIGGRPFELLHRDGCTHPYPRRIGLSVQPRSLADALRRPCELACSVQLRCSRTSSATHNAPSRGRECDVASSERVAHDASSAEWHVL